MSRFDSKTDFGKKDYGYQDKIRMYKTKNLYRALLVVVILAVIAVIIRIQYMNHVYTGYDVVSQVERQKSIDARDVRLGKSVLTYSKDGAHLTDAKGNVLWNQTYEIQDIKVKTGAGVVAIGNYNGRDIYVLNEKEQLCTISTTMPIRNLTVSENGYTTAVIYDTNVTYLNTYDEKGNEIFSGQNHMSNSGYPAAISLSPNGKLLQVAFMYVDAGMVKTRVAFYNFGPVGDNNKDYLVSGFDYTDMIVPEVGFLSNSTAYAVGDGRLMIYSGDEQPGVKAEYLYDQEIRSVYSGNGYVGLVFMSDKQDSRYKLVVYNNAGNLEGEYYFDIDYSEIFFEKNDFVIYNDTECLITTYEGKEKFNGNFSEAISVMVPTDKAYRYIIGTDKELQTIQLN